jgi:hypothetical protein
LVVNMPLFFKRIGAWLRRNRPARAAVLEATADRLRDRAATLKARGRTERAQDLVDAAEVAALRARQQRARAGVGG